MDVTPLDLDDTEAMAQVAGLAEACRRTDTPFLHETDPEMLALALRYNFDQEPSRHFVGRDPALRDGRVVVYGASYHSTWENLDVSWFEGHVHPDVRRRGIGTQMLEHLESSSVAMGRPSVGAEAFLDNAGVAFLERHGYQLRAKDVARRQTLAELDLDDVRHVRTEAAATAGEYALERLVGGVPEDILDEFCHMAHAINDAPLDDLDLEDDVYAPQRIRDHDEAMRMRRRHHLRLLARHRATGEIVGVTEVVVEQIDPTRAAQYDTTVVRAHRGHRLGLLLKSEMVLWLAEDFPAVRTVDTWNAQSNSHMIAVNDRLGYRPIATSGAFQKRLTDSLASVH